MTEAAKNSSRGPEMLLDLADQAAEILRDVGNLAPETASELGMTIAKRMAEQWGGRQFYFPKGVWFDLDQRDWQIYSEYDGTNRQEICRRYSISPSRLYQILHAVRRQLRGRRKTG